MSNNDNFDLSRRKVLGGLGTIGAAGALGGAGTMAFFSDTEEFEGNEIVAGELDLKVDWEEHYSDWLGEETKYASMQDGSLVVDDLDGFMEATLVEAFPDEDDDAIQDFTDEPACSDNSNLAGGDLPEVLESDLRTDTREEEGLNGQVTAPGDPLINLQDVKPGDSGEVTFSLHLCDNPGYIWLTGDLVENAENSVNDPEAEDPDENNEPGNAPYPEGAGELADEILVRAWYDPDCDNVIDSGESIIFAEGTLSQLMTVLEDRGLRLSAADSGVGGGGSSTTTTTDSGGSTEDLCEPLGKIEWDDQDDDDDNTLYEFEVEDDSNDEKIENPDDGAVGDVFRLRADDGTDRYADIKITEVEYKDTAETEPIRIEFEIVDGNPSNIGICETTVKGGTSSFTYDQPECITGATNISTDQFSTDGDTQPAISNISFKYCLQDDGGGGDKPDEPVCFQPGTTYCIGFDWRLPVDHANELQTDSVAFDLGFYTEQCRHNPGTGGPPTTTTTDDT